MLLAKPKKDYKSVSKTELMKETLEESEKEANPSEEAFNIYDEFQEVCEKVGDNEWPKQQSMDLLKKWNVIK